MKTLVVEDDFTSRLLLQEILNPYGTVHIAVNGKEAVQAFGAAVTSGEPYNLICLDVMMPELNGFDTLKQIRGIEEAQGIASSSGAKIVMTTALDGVRNMSQAFQSLCDAYLVKPISKRKLLDNVHSLGLI